MTSETIHETEVQRRHARVKLPAHLLMPARNGDGHLALRLLDLSASGFGVKLSDGLLRTGKRYTGELQFALQTVFLRLPVTFTVLYTTADQTKAGCELHNMGKEEIGVLRLLISKYLAGELIESDDILATVSRDNYLTQRSHPGSSALTGIARVRAVAGTMLAGCIGVLACIALLTALYDHFFITHADSAAITVQREVVQAPADGYFELLAGENQTLAAGTPLASITSSAFQYIKQSELQQLERDELASLLPASLSSVVKSPCECKILTISGKERQFSQQGETLFELVRADSKPYIAAQFAYRKADKIPQGTRVSFEFPGESATYYGIVETVEMYGEHHPGMLLVTIRSDQPLPIESVNRPVRVSVSSGRLSLGFVEEALAWAVDSRENG